MARKSMKTLLALAMAATGATATPPTHALSEQRGACGTSNSNYVGYTAPLTERAHAAGGILRIVDDCTACVSNFKWDGAGPAVFWYGGADTTFANGRTLTAQYPGGQGHGAVASDKMTTCFALDGVDGDLNPLTWETANIHAISLWCDAVNTSFADAQLRPANNLHSLSSTGGCTTTTHPYVGFVAELTTLAHGVSGTLSVVNDCTACIDNFAWDGAGPDVYWYGGAENTSASFAQGRTLSPHYVGGAGNGAATADNVRTCFGLTGADDNLNALTWTSGNTHAVSFWCDDFSANFASAMLGDGARPFTDTTDNMVSMPTTTTTTTTTTLADTPVIHSLSEPRGQCGTANSPLVGYTVALDERAHAAGGILRIVDDCTACVSNFKWDGAGPSVFWYGAADTTFANGVTLSAQYPGGAGHGAVATDNVTTCFAINGVDSNLNPHTWESAGISAISLWCDQVDTSFADAMLSPAAANEHPLSSQGGCNTSDHPFVGYSAEITTLAHEVAGTLTVVNDCTICVDGFVWDGQGPDVFWYGAAENTTASFTSGRTLSAHYVGGAGNGRAASDNARTCFGLTGADDNLNALTWATANINAISLWCDQVSANFGSAPLGNGPRPFTAMDNTVMAPSAVTAVSMAPTVTYNTCATASTRGNGNDWCAYTINLTTGDTPTTLLLECEQLVAEGEGRDCVVTSASPNRWFALGTGNGMVGATVARYVPGEGASWESITSTNAPVSTTLTDREAPVATTVDGSVELAFKLGTNGDASVRIVAAMGTGATWEYHTNTRVTTAVEFTNATVTTADSSANPAPTNPTNPPATATPTISYPVRGCKMLSANMKVNWELRENDIDFDFRAAFARGTLGPQGDGAWAAMGVSRVSSGAMVGSRVAILRSNDEDPATTQGTSAGATFGPYDMRLQSQCGTDVNGDLVGVCPEDTSAVPEDAANLNEMFDEITIEDHFLQGKYTRRVSNGTDSDRLAISLTDSTTLTWGFGELFINSVVAKHEFSDRGTVQVDLFTASDDCTDLPSADDAAWAMPYAQEGDGCPAYNAEGLLVEDMTRLNAPMHGTGDQRFPLVHFTEVLTTPADYPCPPGWGEAFAINGQTLASLVLKRGESYWFLVEASDNHPVYLTSDRNGAYFTMNGNNDDEQVYWPQPEGSTTVMNALINAPSANEGAGTPVLVTVGEDWPEDLWYQCTVHQRIGWRVHIEDADAAEGSDGFLSQNPSSASGNTSTVMIALSASIAIAFALRESITNFA